MSKQPKSEMTRLLGIMARLRDPDGGCPWDLEQDFSTIAPYTIEEAYEVAEAVRANDMGSLREELGDLLLQVVYHAQMAAEAGHFDFDDVARGICEKMVRRHPHVFGDAAIDSARAQTDEWERQKAEERAARGETSALDGVSLSLPALLRARKLVSRAARAGFAWPDVEDAARKVAEELEEVRAEISTGDHARIEEELGDLLIAAVGLAQRLEVEPETALRRATAKFEGRLRALESALAEEGRRLADADPAELLERWGRAK
jgi:MazG family protein